MNKYILLLMTFIVACATATTTTIRDDSYYQALAQKDISINEINDDATYHEIKMYEKVDHQKYEYKRIDEIDGCRLYQKISKDELFDVVSVGTDEKDIVVKIDLIKLFPIEKLYDSQMFFNRLVLTLSKKYKKLKPFFKNIDDFYAVSFCNKEDYKQKFIKEKKQEDRSSNIDPLKYWFDRNMIHPILSGIEINKVSTDKFIMVKLKYMSNRYSEIAELTSRTKKKKFDEKLKGF